MGKSPAQLLFVAMFAFLMSPFSAADTIKRAASPGIVMGSPGESTTQPKAASTNTVASRATSTGSATVYGGFELAASAVVYILVRGNSLGTLGVTSAFLDAPRVRLFNSQGQDLVSDSTGRAGFNGCVSSNTTTDLPVINYYQNVRGQPTHSRDACVAFSAPAGAYTFSVTPSVLGSTSGSTSSFPSAGEILFEVTLGPGGGVVVDDNRSRTERLVGGTWTYTYTIISTFSDRYTFSTVSPSTSTPGEWVAFGVGEFNDPVIGGYVTSTNSWLVLDPGSIIDQLFVFTFSGTNNVSGCYHQINPPGSTNIGTCRSMTGSRFPPKALVAADPGKRMRAAAEGLGEPLDTNPGTLAGYLQLREALGRRLEATAKGSRASLPGEEAENRLAAAIPEATLDAPKAASTRTVASRATATPGATVYGGFELASSATVYILARGNSLGTLGVTQSYLDLPRLRLFDSAGRDLAFDTSGAPGFNRCVVAGAQSAPVRDYYSRIRNAPAHDNDACTSRTLSPGAYTFSVTPSISGVTSPVQSVPSSGEILFEVTLGP